MVNKKGIILLDLSLPGRCFYSSITLSTLTPNLIHFYGFRLNAISSLSWPIYRMEVVNLC